VLLSLPRALAAARGNRRWAFPGFGSRHSVPSARSPSKAELSFSCRGRRRRLFSVSVPYQRI